MLLGQGVISKNWEAFTFPLPASVTSAHSVMLDIIGIQPMASNKVWVHNPTDHDVPVFELKFENKVHDSTCYNWDNSGVIKPGDCREVEECSVKSLLESGELVLGMTREGFHQVDDS